MSSVIKIRTDKDWGTCFCVTKGERLVFYTATHVFDHMGAPIDATSADLQMCDQFTSLRTIAISNITRTPSCDVASFECEFPAFPFQHFGECYKEDKVKISGYLKIDGKEPDCDTRAERTGRVMKVGRINPCKLMRLSIHLNMPTGHLSGMSGAPVLKEFDNNLFGVVAIFNGAPFGQGGPPFTATVMPR